jgi:predicted exporter
VEELPARLSDEGLRESARRLRSELLRPSSTLVARIAGEDPLLAFPALLDRVLSGDQRLGMRDGVFVTRDGAHAILFLGTRASPFDADRQRPLLAFLRERFEAIRAAEGGDLVLETAGMNRFALDIEDGIRGELPLLFAASTLGVTLLFLTFFRSPRALGLALIPHALGVLVAATTGLLVFGYLNGLAIAFGAALIGVTVDYSIHLLNHHGLAPPGTTPQQTLRAVRPSLLLGGGTTIASFAGLAFADFPGFYQMCVLATVGVGAALATTLLLLPRWMGEPHGSQATQGAALWLGGVVIGLTRHRTALAVVSLAAAALALWGAPRIRWVDDMSKLTVMNPELVREDQAVRARISSMDPGRVLVARGATLEQAVAANDRLAARLPELVEAGVLSGYRTLHSFVWSEALQRENRELLLRDASLPERLERAYAAEGFRPGAFAGFVAALASPQPEPLRYEDVARSPVGDLARALVLDLGDEKAVVTLLEGVQDAAALEAALVDLPGVRLFDQMRFIREVSVTYRQRIVEVVLGGCVAGLLLLWLRYRALRPALAAALPSLLVAGLLVALGAALGTEAHVLHLIALFLVIGIGGDFGILMVDGDSDALAVGTTMLSLLIASLTTIFTFGVLGFSEHPVLHAIGRTTSLGIALAFLLAPSSLVLMGGQGPSSSAGAAES